MGEAIKKAQSLGLKKAFTHPTATNASEINENYTPVGSTPEEL